MSYDHFSARSLLAKPHTPGPGKASHIATTCQLATLFCLGNEMK